MRMRRGVKSIEDYGNSTLIIYKQEQRETAYNDESQHNKINKKELGKQTSVWIL